MTTGPLNGVRVIEFGNLIAAPYAGMLLADLGAEVVKVEPPGGDLGRRFGPFIKGESVFFLAVNRGKKSVVIDLQTPDGMDTARRLCGTADVVLHNLRRGAMERRGLGPDAIRTTNPEIVYAVVSAFGSDGPFADRPGIDVVFQGESGMISITGDPDSPPTKTATTIGDYVAATNAALAICAALASGKGQFIDVSLRDGLLAVQSGWYGLAFAIGDQPVRTGTASPFLAPNQVFETADGHMTLAIAVDRHFEMLCDALDRPDLKNEYPTNEVRMERRRELIPILEEIFRARETGHWLEIFGEAGIPAGRILNLPEVWDDPQAQHNEMVITYDHPTAGSVRGIGSPIRIDGSPSRAAAAPPVLGEHTGEVLGSLDLG